MAMTEARRRWKVYYRLLRIARRESWKAAMDMAIYGTGYIHVDPNNPDLCQHIPIQDIRIDPVKGPQWP